MEENVIQINGKITINVDVNNKHHICEKGYIQNPATCSCENGKNLGNIMDDSAITCDEITESYDEEAKTIQQVLLKKI